MRLGLLLMIVALICPTLAFGQKLKGRLAIGDELFAVTGEVITNPGGTLRLSLDLSRTGKGSDHTLLVLVTPKGGQATVDGYSFPVSAQVVADWHSQLRRGASADVSQDQFLCRTEAGGGRTCDSKGLVTIGPGLPGRLRLSYNRGRLIGLRFFSLAEWNNRFQAYASLSLDIQ